MFMKAKRETWKSSAGFIFAAMGSAVGIANICIFPCLVGANGGAAFIAVYLISLLLIGFPVFISEITLGRKTHRNPAGAFKEVGKTKLWSRAGLLTVVTGLIVTAFYSVLAGWVLGYFVEAIAGRLHIMTTIEETSFFYNTLMSKPLWALAFHFIFIVICGAVLYGGVRHGIERGSKFMMPILIVILLFLVVRGLMLPGAGKGLKYLLSPDWSMLTPAAILLALGQAFFTLSLGQGTMVTYGSYLTKKDSIPSVAIPVALGDTAISLCAAIVVFTTVFSVGMEPSQGLGLIFQTLPIVFGQLPGGYLLAVVFFLFVTLAAVTSEISAMEPVIAYLVDERQWRRHSAVAACTVGGFLLGIPCALSYSILKGVTLSGVNIMDAVMFITEGALIPAGGFFAVILVGWVWRQRKALRNLREGSSGFFDKNIWFRRYLWLCIKYVAPVLIIVVFLNRIFG
ncbi:MAG: sodium-dependent transporter [Waddliaceae bacterium]|nr:sodium-dependent transporter [Waddliaceae bacterium]